MAARRILQLGDPLLREVSRMAQDFRSTAPILQDLCDTLHEFQRAHGFGRGISAVQIGVLERVIYLEFSGTPYCLINPQWTFKSEEKFQLWDDCFSFPNLLVWLERSQSVRLKYMSDDGAEKTLEASGALSELLQHEMDHLDGILAIDRALDKNSLCTREEWQRRHARSA